jgi:hypothetical protein
MFAAVEISPAYFKFKILFLASNLQLILVCQLFAVESK